MFFTLVEHDRNPRLAGPRLAPPVQTCGIAKMPYDADRIRAQPFTFVPNAFAHASHRLVGRLAVHQCQVFFFMLVARVGQAMGQIAVVRQQQQPFAIRIQSAGRVKTLAARDQIERKRFAQSTHGFAGRGVYVAQVAARLVQNDVLFLLGAQLPAVDLNPIAERVDLDTQLGDDPPIDANALSDDELLAFATRCNSGVSEHFV